MSTYTARRLGRMTAELAQWQRAAVMLLVLSVASNTVFSGLLGWEKARNRELQAQVEEAEAIRDRAVRELGAASLASAKEAQARREQAAAYEAVGAWEYIGECTVTAYCPCAECCGRWADGFTCTGLPAGPGVAAVDPEVIPLGSTVVIDGQRYLAADTGVTGARVDLCRASHREAAAFGVQAAQVWVIPAGEGGV